MLFAASCCAALSACAPAAAPTLALVQTWAEPYMYEGQEVRVVILGSSDPARSVTITFENLSTRGRREMTLARQGDIRLKLDATTIPDLEGSPAVLPLGIATVASSAAPSWTGALGGLGSPGEQRFETRVRVVRDREARFPPFQPPTTPLSRPNPGDSPDRWAQVADESLMEDVALGLAFAWGGRDLRVSRRPLTREESSRLPGADAYLPEVAFHLVEVSGKFPKHVVPAELSGQAADTIAIPRGIRAVLPQIQRPFTVRFEVVI